jgi:hypothetical protein
MAMTAAGVVGVGLVASIAQPQWFRAKTEAAKRPLTIPSAGPAAQTVWKVESSQTEEVYSNGLRIDLSFVTRNRPRAEYPIFAMVGDSKPIGSAKEPPKATSPRSRNPRTK